MPDPSHAERSLPPIARIARSLASALDVREVMQRVAEAAVELTRAQGAYVEQVVSPAGTVEVVARAGRGTPQRGTCVPYPGSLTEEIIEGGLPVLLTELGEVGEGVAPYLTEHCADCSGMVAPLLSEGEVLGALVLLRGPEQEHFGEQEAERVRTLGDLASVSLRRVQLLEESRREREERTALLDSTGEGIYGVDREGRCTFLNRSGARILGFAPEEVLGRNMHRLIHHTRPDGRPYPEEECPIYHAARAGRGMRVDDEVLWRRDGTSFPAEYGTYPIREDGRIRGAVVTFRDVSDRRRVEAERERLLERARFLAEASIALASSLDYQATLDRVAQLAVPRIADYCIIDVLEADGRLHRVGSAHVDPEREALLASSRRFAPAPGSDSPALRALQSGRPELVPEVTDEWLQAAAQSPDHLAMMRRLGPRSLILVPLAARGRTLGLLWLVAAGSGRRYGPEELELAEELGRRAAVAVDNAGLYAAAQEARGEAERRALEEGALREAIAAVSASASTEEVIRRVAGSAVTATNADGAFVERIDISAGEVAVVAASGAAAPAVGSRVPYVGSFAEQVVEGSEPRAVPRLAESERHLPGDLGRARPDDSALVLPLVDGGEPIGALVLLRGPEKWRFRPDEVRRAHTFAALAALAFRKIHMLEDSEQRREELQRVMESRARLMRGFSHDVKNPLGAADGFLALLEDGIGGELQDRQREYVGRARRSIGNSLALIEDLLELARAEAGQIEIQWVPVDVRDAVHELGEEYRAQARAKGLEVEMRLPDELPVIQSDATRVRQILGNLLSNAVKYTDRGGVEVSVELRPGDRLGRPGEWVAADVRDTGPGIPADKQRLLFQEFTRLDPGEKKGAGVGLAISQRIAHALGGEITVRSEAGRGSVFTLWLPCTRGEPEDARPTPETAP